jgi:thiol-disulfide isomerase/thioredoxin
LISDQNNQRFSIDIKNNDAVFYRSDENTANMLYMKTMREYSQQSALLNTNYQKIQQSNESLTEKQAKVDEIIRQSQAINAQKLAYQAKVAQENKGKLLASIILSVMEVPPPPAEFRKDRTLYYKYLAEYCFYKYDFSDDRILSTPLAINKFRMFNEIIFELDADDAIPYVLNALRKSQASPQQYYELFDYIERDFGNVKSPMRKEPLYIAMLRYAIDSTYIDEYRKTRYLYELDLIDKNHAGQKLPNFNLLMNNGDTTNLYDIKAERLLLYLQNPDCPTCKKVREKLKEMEAVLSAQKITVLTVYFENDKNLWQNYLQNNAYPNWKHGWNYDLTIEEKQLIDIRSIPALYLLNKDKIILIKDIDIHELEEILE